MTTENRTIRSCPHDKLCSGASGAYLSEKAFKKAISFAPSIMKLSGVISIRFSSYSSGGKKIEHIGIGNHAFILHGPSGIEMDDAVHRIQ
jgi:hypothetical protein